MSRILQLALNLLQITKHAKGQLVGIVCLHEITSYFANLLHSPQTLSSNFVWLQEKMTLSTRGTILLDMLLTNLKENCAELFSAIFVEYITTTYATDIQN